MRSYIRAAEWWEYKLVPILAIFFATALSLDVRLTSIWPAALALLACLAPGAAYVSVINDLTDKAVDQAAGKPNRMAKVSAGLAAVLVAVPVFVGLGFLFAWRGDALLFGCYLAAWISYSLYSLPPARLKARGIWGVLADASGAHLFPTLVAMILAFRAAGAPIAPLWAAGVALWALGYGLRGILRHQILDAEHDRLAGVNTFVRQRSVGAATAVGVWLAMPMEMAGLGLILATVGDLLPAAFLLGYVLLAGLKRWIWGSPVVIVGRPGPHLMLGQEFYEVLFPLSILLAAGWRHPIDLVVLALHLVLFPRRALFTATEAWRLFQTIVREALKKLRRVLRLAR